MSSAFVVRRRRKTAAPLACARSIAHSYPGAVDPESTRLDGGILVFPLPPDTFTPDYSSETWVPGPQDLAGVLKRLWGEESLHGVRIPYPFLGPRISTTSVPGRSPRRWWLLVLVSPSGYRSTGYQPKAALSLSAPPLTAVPPACPECPTPKGSWHLPDPGLLHLGPLREDTLTRLRTL